MTTSGLEPDPYEADVPDAVWSLWAPEVAAWHTPDSTSVVGPVWASVRE